MRFLGDKCIEIWTIEDVEHAAYKMGTEISRQEAKTVLMYMARYFDSSTGTNWAFIQEMIRLVKEDGEKPDSFLQKNQDTIPAL